MYVYTSVLPQAGNSNHLSLNEWPLSFRYGNVLDFSRPSGKEDAPLNLNKSTAYQEPSRTTSAKQHYLRQSRYLPGNILYILRLFLEGAGAVINQHKLQDQCFR